MEIIYPLSALLLFPGKYFSENPEKPRAPLSGDPKLWENGVAPSWSALKF